MPVIQAWIPKHPDYFPLMHEKLKECQDDSPWQMCKRIKAVMHEVSQKIKDKRIHTAFSCEERLYWAFGALRAIRKGDSDRVQYCIARYPALRAIITSTSAVHELLRHIDELRLMDEEQKTLLNHESKLINQALFDRPVSSRNALMSNFASRKIGLSGIIREDGYDRY